MSALVLSLPLIAGKEDTRPRFGSSENAVSVSIYALLSSPEKFVGVRIQVIGVIAVRDEDHALYSDDESFRLRIATNSVALRLDADGLKRAVAWNRRYVVVDGYFEKLGSDLYGPIGRLHRITDIRPFPVPSVAPEE